MLVNWACVFVIARPLTCTTMAAIYFPAEQSVVYNSQAAFDSDLGLTNLMNLISSVAFEVDILFQMGMRPVIAAPWDGTSSPPSQSGATCDQLGLADTTDHLYQPALNLLSHYNIKAACGCGGDMIQ